MFRQFLNICRRVSNYIFINSDEYKFWETEWNSCPKKHLHEQYFAASLLPNSDEYNEIPGYTDNNDLANIIQCMIPLTGMILIKIPNKDIQFGSGFVQRIRKKNGHCPCGANAHHEDGEFAILTITTVNHVVSSKEVVQHATFVLDFNDEDQRFEECIKLQGLRLLDTDREVSDQMDWCAVEFVTHNMDVVRKLEKSLENYETLQNVLYNMVDQRKSALEKSEVTVVKKLLKKLEIDRTGAVMNTTQSRAQVAVVLQFLSVANQSVDSGTGSDILIITLKHLNRRF
ncbi:uncharacterized protein LOC131944255 [Physella acuta]|uniref:uncharacterized protein LOC131944255 n=1 Tax=Physella acuta TaxID=109671 RepID=UPI0027DCA3BD|nr:uncharacterized protein LOC131944255 [Physella acuta]XP_059160778.1 uncharacterized protein LOC131944255 [Physella acuta]